MGVETPRDDKEIIEKIHNGYSLRTFMMPDPSIPSNAPQHVETLELPHIIVNGRSFWGKSETVHLFHVVGTGGVGHGAYCYTNSGDMYCSYTSDISSLTAFLKDRYKKHVWLLKKNYKMIWDSDENSSTKVVEKEIELGSKFKIAMLDVEDVWNIHPVDLPMFKTKTGLFQLMTASEFYPSFFRERDSADQLKEMIKQKVGDSPDVEGKLSALFEANFCAQFDTPCFSTFYSLYSDGTYYNYYDIPRATTKQYKRLKVFTDNL